MWKIVVVGVAGVLIAAALVSSEIEVVHEKVAVAEAGEMVDEARMRLCVGPARVTLGGQPFTSVAFGGDGCGADKRRAFGVRIFKGPADTVQSALALTWR